MTNEDAINYFKRSYTNGNNDDERQHNEALDKAVKALERTRWIPVSEGLPEELEPVNITWINRNPESYYADIKDKPFTATGVYFNGQWYWWSTLCIDILAEYSHNYDDIIDDAIEIIAWQPLPQPYAESEDKEMTEEDKLYADELRKRAYSDYERLDHAINELERQTCDTPRNNLAESSQVRMTLDEAIERFEKLASDYEFNLNMHKNHVMNLSVSDIERMQKYLEENRQLTEWLRALKEIWDSGDCNDCRNGQCKWKPKLGQLVRYNCPHYVGIANGEVNADEDSD